MTTDIFRRIVWKEYRMLRGFWIALAAFVLAGQFAASMYVRDAEDVRMALIAIMSVAVALYALGAAATVFAVEREEGTVSLLQALPVQSPELFRAKVTFAAASTVLLAALLALVTWAWNLTGLVHVRWDSGKFSQEVLGGALIYGAAAMSVFVCGLFFSLVLKRPLVAACLAAVAACGVFYVANVAEVLWTFGTWWEASPRIIGRATTIAFVSELSVIFAIDVYLGRRWLRDLDFSALAPRSKRRGAAARAEATIAREPSGPSIVTAFRRLAWQEFHQAWRMMLIFIGIGAISAVSTATLRDPDKTRVAFAFPLASGLVAVMGACVFLSDQERSQFRFFAERPVRPRLVWLNRQFVWLAVIGTLLLVGVPLWVESVFGDLRILGQPIDIGQGLVSVAARTNFAGGLFELPIWALFAVFAAVAYSCGQLCSMMFKSGIIAGFMAVILTGAVSFWAALMAELGVDWRLAVGPIPLFLLFATWLRAPHWIGERSGPWPWTRLALSLALPALGVGIATATYRVVQIPLVDPGFSPAEYGAQVTPEARETAVMYERASAMIDNAVWNEQQDEWNKNKEPADEEAKKAWLAAWHADYERVETLWLHANPEPLQLALAAAERPACIFSMAIARQDLQRAAGPAERLISADARHLRRKGDLDGALAIKMALLRMSVHLRRHQFITADGDGLEQEVLRELRDSWATRPGQTPERIRACIKALDDWHKTVPRPTDGVEAQHVWFEKLLMLDPDALSDEAASNEAFKETVDFLVFTAHLMPWERARARRALDYFTSALLAIDHRIETALRGGEPTSLLVFRTERSMGIDKSLLATTPWFFALLDSRRNRFPPLGSSGVDLETQRQATRLLLALVGWQIEHGALPQSLDALVGSYLDQWPRDPWSGQPFHYFPRGMGQTPDPRLGQSSAISAATPVIWSCGPGLVAGNDEEALGWQVDVPSLGRRAFRNLPSEVREAFYFPIDNGALRVEALSLEAALPRGIAMPIPKPEGPVEP